MAHLCPPAPVPLNPPPAPAPAPESTALPDSFWVFFLVLFFSFSFLGLGSISTWLSFFLSTGCLLSSSYLSSLLSSLIPFFCLSLFYPSLSVETGLSSPLLTQFRSNLTFFSIFFHYYFYYKFIFLSSSFFYYLLTYYYLLTTTTIITFILSFFL